MKKTIIKYNISMKKETLFKLTCISASVSATLPLVSMVSCNEKFKINFEEPILSGKVKTFTFEGTTEISPKKGLTVEIDGEDAHLEFLSLKSSVVYVSHKKVQITINLYEFYNENHTFNFNLHFTNNDTNEIITVEGFSIIYQNSSTKKDIVRIVDNSLEGTSEYKFTYKFLFSAKNKGTSGLVHASLEGVSSDLITLPEKDVYIEEEDEVYALYVNLNVNIAKTHSFIEDFIINLEFENSFGEHQEESADVVLRFFFDINQKFIPIDYFEVKKGVLTGIQAGVSRDEVARYTTLKIPDGVTSISEKVFDGKNPNFDFSNITTIIFPNSISQLPIGCFAGLSSLFYIDITSYTSWPTWFKSQSASASVFSTTPDKSFKYNGGIVWANDAITNKTAIGDSIVNPTFSHWQGERLWSVCHKDDVIPDSFYELQEDTETHEIMLSGIKKEKIQYLKDYQIIQIPEEVNVIKKGAFKNFVDNPYYDESKDTHYRRLIPNKNLKKIEDNALENLCLGSYILFECPKLEEFGIKSFAKARWYKSGTASSGPIIEANSSIFFKGCDNFKKFDDYCFYFGWQTTCPGWNNISPLVIPKSTENIGKCLFGGENANDSSGIVNDIVFENCPKLNFDVRAFCNTRKLHSIDLSAVTYENFMNWTTSSKDEDSGVFLYSGFSPTDDHIVYVNPNLTEDQINDVKNKLSSPGWGLNLNNWRVEEKTKL